MSITITPYAAQDKQGVCDLILGIMHTEVGDTTATPETTGLDKIPHNFPTPDSQFWVAKDGDRVVGTIALANKGNGIAILKRMYVEQAYRGQHIARRLFVELVRFACTKKIRRILLSSQNTQTTAHQFYRNLGFRETNLQIFPETLPSDGRERIIFQASMEDLKARLANSTAARPLPMPQRQKRLPRSPGA